MAKRLVVILAYFSLSGLLTQQRLADVESLEAALEEEQTFQKVARRISRVLATLDVAPAGAAPDETRANSHDPAGDEIDELLAADADAAFETDAPRVPRRARKAASQKDADRHNS